jgi:hypothetical protein
MNKYLVIEVEEYGEGFEVMQGFYTKEEIYEEYYGTYVNCGCDDWCRVKDEEQAYELLMMEFEDCFSILEFLEKYGEECPLSVWKDEMKDRICHRLDPRLEIYEVLENGLKPVGKL